MTDREYAETILADAPLIHAWSAFQEVAHRDDGELREHDGITAAFESVVPLVAALVAATEERGAAKERERTDRVRELHRPVEADGLPEDCLEGECEHNPDGECPEVTVTVCADCDGQREALGGEMLVIWPCATIKALDGSS